MPTGIEGFAQGLMQGMPAGAVLGDRIAALRAHNRMADVQNALDAGQFDPSNFGGDSAAAQQALQVAVRSASNPLDARGLAGDEGDQQYNRLVQLQQQRGNQRAGAMMNAGDLPGGVAASGQTSAMLGDLPQAMQAGQMSQQIRAGQNAITNTGPGGSPMVDQQALAQGTATAAAQYGNNQGAAQWGGQELQQRNAAIQTALGKALTVAQSQGLQAAAPYFHTGAQLAGYGDVQWSPKENALVVLDKQGTAVATLNNQNVTQFAQSVGNDPQQILTSLRSLQGQDVSDRREQIKQDTKLLHETQAKVVDTPWSDVTLRAIQQEAKTSMNEATKGGWTLDTGTAQDVKDADGNVIGKRYLVQDKMGGAPYTMTVGTVDPSNGGDPLAPAVTVTDANGREIQANALPEAMGRRVLLAQKAVADQAKADWFETNTKRSAAQMSALDALGRSWGVTNGQQPAGALPTTQAPSALQNYQSTNSDLNGPQMRQESGGNQGAVSSAGAQGVMQLMPGTRAELEQEFGLPPGSSIQNTPQGTYLNQQLGQVYRDRQIARYTQIAGSPQVGRVLGLMAYNWGPGNVDKWLQNGAPANQVPAETRGYIESLLGRGRKAAPAQAPGAPSRAALPKVTGAPIQTHGLNASLATNADAFLLPRR